MPLTSVILISVIGEPVKEENDWWYHVKSVICFGRVRIVTDEAEHTARLRQFGAKYFPEGYDLEGDMRNSAPHAAVLEFTIEHMTGKRVREK